MIDKTDIQKSFNFSGVLVVAFNAMIFDFLVVGYSRNSDITKMSDLLTNVTVGVFFETALVVVIGFSIYTVVFKEPLIWVLSKIYFIVVLLRVVMYPFWRVRYTSARPRNSLDVAKHDWNAYCQYQLGTNAKWTTIQHLSVATFFMFLLSLISPILGFQSLGYRLLPPILSGLGVPPSYHWIGAAIIIVSICYTCSNCMLALFGDHGENFNSYYKRRVSEKWIGFLGEKQLQMEDLTRQAQKVLIERTDLSEGVIENMESIIFDLKELIRLVEANPEGDHDHIRQIFQEDFSKSDGIRKSDESI